mgnify:CR=1 FL=1
MIDWIGLAVLSAFASAGAAITQKRVLAYSSPLVFSFLLSIVNFALFLPFVQYHILLTLSTSATLLLIAKSIINNLAFLLVMIGLKNLPISRALPILALTPAIVALSSIVILNENLAALQWVGLIGMLIGAYLVEMKSVEDIMNTLLFRNVLSDKSIYPIFAALALFSLSAVVDRYFLSHIKIPVTSYLFYMQLFSLPFFGAMLILKRHSLKKVFEVTKPQLYLLLLIGIFTVLYRYTQFAAIALAPAALVLAVKRISVLISTVVGGNIFAEKNLILKSIGVILIVASGFLLLNAMTG